MHFGFTIARHSEEFKSTQLLASSGLHFTYHLRNGQDVFTFLYKKKALFKKDKLFFENKEFIAGLDGVILNQKKLQRIYSNENWGTLFITLYKKHNDLFINELKGEFSGFVFNKNTEKLIYFTNHSSSQRIYYFHSKETTFISPSIQTITKLKLESDQKSELNITSAYSLLIYGGMYGNATLVNDVFRLHGGEYLEVDEKNLFLKKYFDFNTIKVEPLSKNQSIELLEEHFQEAVKLEYQKDAEYNLKHLSTLSGGLDSRLNVGVASQNGFEVTNFCFSQKGYDDETIARQIAKSLDQQFIFEPLDGGDYIFDFEENMEVYEGQIFYTTSAHFNYAIKKIDLSLFGIIHAGILGGGLLGAFLTRPEIGPPNLYNKIISKKLFSRIETEMNALATQFASEEIFHLHQRYFNITISGAFAMEKYNYLVSPFSFPDFMETCLKIEPKLKYQYKIYIEWINKFHKPLTGFKWETTGFRPLYTWQKPLSRYTNKIKHLWYRFNNKSHLLNMTPYDYWYQNNPKIGEFMTKVFNEKICHLDGNKELQRDASELFLNGNAVEKTLVMTLLGAIEQLKISV